jgi:hypothetical protein
MLKKLATLLLICLIVGLCFGIVGALSPEIDRVATVTRVIDGDTIDVDGGYVIRFADVNTPEVEEAGYKQAKDFVTNLVKGKTVYLDIDNKTVTDPYNRLVCVIYFDYNSTHYENLNKALLVANLAVVDDFSNNDFNPDSWSLYVPKSQIAIQEFPITALFVVVLVVVSLLLGIGKRKLSYNH